MTPIPDVMPDGSGSDAEQDDSRFSHPVVVGALVQGT